MHAAEMPSCSPPVPGDLVIGLFLDGELVELVDDPLDVAGYLRRNVLRAA